MRNNKVKQRVEEGAAAPSKSHKNSRIREKESVVRNLTPSKSEKKSTSKKKRSKKGRKPFSSNHVFNSGDKLRSILKEESGSQSESGAAAQLSSCTSDFLPMGLEEGPAFAKMCVVLDALFSDCKLGGPEYLYFKGSSVTGLKFSAEKQAKYDFKAAFSDESDYDMGLVWDHGQTWVERFARDKIDTNCYDNLIAHCEGAGDDKETKKYRQLRDNLSRVKKAQGEAQSFNWASGSNDSKSRSTEISSVLEHFSNLHYKEDSFFPDVR